MTLLWWLLACEQPETDAERFTRLMELPAPDAAEDLPQCALIADLSQRGECQNVVGRRAAEGAGLAPETWCGTIEHTMWRAECYFRAAERWGRHGDAARAAGLCLQATSLRDDCAQHLWQEQVRALVAQTGSAGFAAQQAAAEQQYAAWAPLLEAQTDLESRFWQVFYRAGFEAGGPVDLSHCDPLAPAYRSFCREIGARHYHNQGVQAVRGQPQTREALCRMEGSADAVYVPIRALQAEPAPELDLAIKELQSTFCGGSPPRP